MDREEVRLVHDLTTQLDGEPTDRATPVIVRQPADVAGIGPLHRAPAVMVIGAMVTVVLVLIRKHHLVKRFPATLPTDTTV
ncbi:MAG: hypothetical protein JWN00_5111 [Actinomycetia bacterium]|nr:hypothetical protein [Actinomycetes bacterium]